MPAQKLSRRDRHVLRHIPPNAIADIEGLVDAARTAATAGVKLRAKRLPGFWEITFSWRGTWFGDYRPHTGCLIVAGQKRHAETIEAAVERVVAAIDPSRSTAPQPAA